ncbi:leukemia inhibitory factor receptor-like [Chelmon rostratus]|uniref:leukemia inhibitory factor receptor-like n=1 Tax=Chelmon rostratus TaxID=109905 RepID=UPI001BE9C890|nr:leukemia inhibitory factor receptor-like [Chelmon rostratus]
MITWLLLVSLFCKSTQDGHGQENGVLHYGPQNLTLTSSDQMILLTWEDDPFCSASDDVSIYEVVVPTADKQVHYEEVAVPPDQIGSTHSWNWMSHLPLECVYHLVRLRSRCRNDTSPWKQVQALPGIENSKRPQVFPWDRAFKVGSRVVFCCILPAGKIFNRMYLMGYNDSYMNTTKINNQTYTLTVQLNGASRGSCTNVICETNTSLNGACAYVGYPPGDTDLQCETRNLQSVECHWTVGRDTHLSLKSPTVYQLLGSKCENGSMGRCKMEVQVDAGERNWTLTAQNTLGKVQLSDCADLTKRVHMIEPKGMTASTVNARNVTLEWEWTVQQYNDLNITCEVNVSHGERNTIRENNGVGLHFVVLNDLIPHWAYNVTVRCGTTQHFWKWSDWSTSINFLTKGDVPDALDVWMQVKGNQTIIIWKMPLANQSHGDIKVYEVTWAKTTERERQNRTELHNKHRLELSLDTTVDYIATVAAWNINGSSSPSTITIPSRSPESSSRVERVNTSCIIGSNGCFNLSWSSSPTASCGYIVDWCPTIKQCKVDWLKVPPNETSARICSKRLNAGVMYTLSVYACTQVAPVLLERREGYISEKRIEDGLFKSLKWKQQDSDVQVSWDPINLREQSAFIQGYVLYCLDNNNNKVIIVNTVNPEATNLTARNLDISSYTFTVKAQTAVGECGTTFFTATLNSLTDNLVKLVFISLVTVFSLLSLIAILCYRHWTWIKQKVYPSIPKPVLRLPSPDGNSCHPLFLDQSHHSEADIVDVSELHCNSVALEYASQENKFFVFSQTAKGYYNQPLKKYIPSSLTLPITSNPSQSGSPSTQFKGVFPNPSYNLIMQSGDRHSNSCPELQEGTHMENSSNGYHPQRNTDTFTVNQTAEDPESPVSCVSTYILLPQAAPQSCCMHSQYSE